MNNPLGLLSKADFNFTGQPVRKEISDYQQAIEDITSAASKSPDLVAIYQIGEISTPGISDIDLIIVLKDQPKKLRFTLRLINSSFSKHSYVFSHKPYVLNVCLMQKIYFLHPIFKLGKIYGREIVLEPVAGGYLNMILLIDCINLWWPKQLFEIMLQKSRYSDDSKLNIIHNDISSLFSLNQKKYKLNCNIRYVLGRLHSLKYLVMMVGRLTKICPQYTNSFIDEITALRRNWFKLGDERYDNLIDILNTSPTVVYRLIKQTTDYLTENCFRIFSFKKTTKIVSSYFRYNENIYISDWDIDRSIAETIKIHKRWNRIFSVLPDNFMFHDILKTNCVFHKQHYGSVQYCSDSFNSESYVKILNQRLSSLQRYKQYLRKNNIGCHEFGQTTCTNRSKLLYSKMIGQIHSIKYSIFNRQLR